MFILAVWESNFTNQMTIAEGNRGRVVKIEG